MRTSAKNTLYSEALIFILELLSQSRIVIKICEELWFVESLK